MHEINRKITFISHTMCIDFSKNEMQDKYNIIFLEAVFAAATRSWLHLELQYVVRRISPSNYLQQAHGPPPVI